MMEKNITSIPSLGSTPGHGHAQVADHNEQQSLGLSCSSSSMSRGLDGGGNEPTPEHPRSRSNTAQAIAAHVPNERRARGTASLSTYTCPTCGHEEQQLTIATAVAHRCPRRGNRVVTLHRGVHPPTHPPHQGGTR
jgi:hypothetical protein